MAKVIHVVIVETSKKDQRKLCRKIEIRNRGSQFPFLIKKT